MAGKPKSKSLYREKALERGVWAVKHAKRSVEDIQYFAEDAGRADDHSREQQAPHFNADPNRL